MEIGPGLNNVPPEDLAQAIRSARHIGCQVFSFATHCTSGKTAFFDALRHQLPLDPPLVGSNSWDALADSLWEGLRIVTASRIAIVWHGAEDWGSRSPREFETAQEVLADVADSLQDAKLMCGQPKEVFIFLV